jgi:hypothetical protein
MMGVESICAEVFMDTKPPLPPFTAETAAQKARMAEDAWNTRDPDRVVQVYTPDTVWRNRAEFPVGREQVRQFLQRKWARELDYRLIKEVWAFAGNRIAVRFAYEWHDDCGPLVPQLMATRTGSSMTRASCSAALPASTICPSRPATANSIGRWVVVRTIILR